MRLALVLLVLGLRVALADGTPPLILDHDMLTSMVRTKEPGVSIGYTADRVEFRTRRSVLVGWVDVLLTARFQRDEKGRVRLVAQSLRAGPIVQRGSRFDQARAGLLRLVDVDTPANRVDIYKAGKRVYTQEIAQPLAPAPPPIDLEDRLPAQQQWGSGPGAPEH